MLISNLSSAFCVLPISVLLASGCSPTVFTESYDDLGGDEEQPILEDTGIEDEGDLDTDTGAGPDEDTGETGFGDCGVNADLNDAGECECVSGYVFRADSTEGCWADGVEKFQVTFHRAQVFPADVLLEKPWDWTGAIPNWLTDDIAWVVGMFYGEGGELIAAEFVDWLDVFEEGAASVFEGSVPPDMYVDASQGGEVFWVSDTLDDNLEPEWNESFNVDLSSGGLVKISMLDEDFWSADDSVMSLQFTKLWFQTSAGVGEVEFEDVQNAKTFVVEVEPIF